MAPTRRLTAAIPALLLLGALPAGAQEEDAGQDTLPAVPNPDSLLGAAADTVPEDTLPPVHFPRSLETPDAATASEVHVWTREDFLDASALTLEGFLADRAPGVLPLRAGYHFGPHHLADGLWGAAGVDVVVDGRRLPPLAAGQVDLSSVSLAGVERLRLVRRAGRTVLEIATTRHEGGEAYSRISAVTGQPSADAFRGLFVNGAGRSFAVGASLDYLNVGAGAMPGNRLDAAARLSWMPWDTSGGIELRWRSENVERTLGGETEAFDRGEVLIHARGRPMAGLELEAWAGRSDRTPRPAFLSPDPVADGDSSIAVDHASARVTATPAAGVVRAGVRVQDGEGLPDLAGEVRAGFPVGDLTLEAGGEAASWDGFSTSEASAAVAWRPSWLAWITVRGEAATGTRAAARPGRPVSDSLRFGFDALTGGIEVEVGPVRLAERVTRQTADSRPPFGGSFDDAASVGPRADVTGWETRFTVPPLPISIFRDRVALQGFWRRSTWEGPAPLYLPADLLRGRIVAHDRFYGGNLEIRASGGLAHRSPMRSVSAPTGETPLLPAETAFLAEFMLRIDTFRFWIRNDNTRTVEQRDFPGFEFPPSRLTFGIRWEFFN